MKPHNRPSQRVFPGGVRIPEMNCTKSGAKIMPTTVRLQKSGDPGNTVHPKIKQNKSVGLTRLRRRLSKSFQRLSHESVFGTRLPFGPGTLGKIHGATCQSPRTQ